MTLAPDHTPRERPPSRRRFVRSALGLGILASGCTPFEPPRLLTSWPLADLDLLPAADLARASTQPTVPFSLANTPNQPPLLIGGSPGATGRESLTLNHLHTVRLGLWFDPTTLSHDELPTHLDQLADPRWRDRIALDDPQVDRGALLAIDHLTKPNTTDWPTRYGAILQAFANSRPPSIGQSSAAFRLRRKEVALTLSACPSWRRVETRLAHFQPLVPNLTWTEISQVTDATDSASLNLLTRLEPNRAGFDSPDPTIENPLADPALPWIADLFQATCVSAHPELRQATDAIAARATRPADADQAAYWLHQPPPWPPASIDQLRDRRDGDRLVDLLLTQIVHHAPARQWLSESWLGPRTPISRLTLTTLASAAESTLAREPHFRAWLRAEWAAWSRQRYRRAARVAQGQSNTTRQPS